jgi:uncharacterized protein (DUF433 family)
VKTIEGVTTVNLGQVSSKALSQLGVKLTDRGNVWRDENWMTSVPGVFAAGDMQRGQSLIVWAIAEGRSPKSRSPFEEARRAVSKGERDSFHPKEILIRAARGLNRYLSWAAPTSPPPSPKPDRASVHPEEAFWPNRVHPEEARRAVSKGMPALLPPVPESGMLLFSPQEVTMNYQGYIVRDPKICGGEPVIKGTRVTVRTILASLAEGASIQEILEDFPTLTEPDVRAVIAFAATSAEEDLPVPSIPNIS